MNDDGKTVDLSGHPMIGGLFQCTKDCPVCLTTCCCPCLTYGLAMNELIPASFRSKNNTCLFCAQCFFCCPFLPFMSSDSAGQFTDLCAWYWCNPCYLCKLRRVSKFVSNLMSNVVANACTNGNSRTEDENGTQITETIEAIEASDVDLDVQVMAEVVNIEAEPPIEMTRAHQ